MKTSVLVGLSITSATLLCGAAQAIEVTQGNANITNQSVKQYVDFTQKATIDSSASAKGSADVDIDALGLGLGKKGGLGLGLGLGAAKNSVKAVGGDVDNTQIGVVVPIAVQKNVTFQNNSNYIKGSPESSSSSFVYKY